MVYITDTRAQKVVSYGVPFIKILYLTDLAQKLLSLHIFRYLCAEMAISVRILAISAQR